MSRFRRRLMGLAALRQAKADDYVRVEYIENTSTAYIDTGVIPNSTYYNVEIKFLNSGNKASTCLYGARDSYKVLFYSFWTNADNLNDVRATNGSNEDWKNYDQSIDTNNKVSVFKLNENTASLTVDGVENTWNITNSAYGATKKIYLFNCNNNNSITPSWNFIGRVYYFKIYENDVLVRDYIPMYQISTDTYGLWDRVNEEFYTSPNGVKFSGGERVIADADDNLYYIKNYISSNNTVNAYITLKKFSNTDNVEFEIYKKQNADSWFGSRKGSLARNLFAISAYGSGININWGQQSPTRIVNNIANDRKHKVRLWNREVFVNGTKVYTCGTNTFTTNTNVTLGKVDGITSASNCNWYYFKWWNVNKDLVYDLIPVQSVDSGKYGMFDKVSLVFHPSNGTAQFTGG